MLLDLASLTVHACCLQTVGIGSYASVHRALERCTGRAVAIKVIKKEVMTADARKQILDEAVSDAYAVFLNPALFYLNRLHAS
jgi:serine/threonine protein kinase